MAKKHKNESVDTNIESLSKAEAFITKHNKKIIAGAAAIVVVVAGVLWYNHAQQKKDEAAKAAYVSVEANALNTISGMQMMTSIEEQATATESWNALLSDLESYMKQHEGHTVKVSSFLTGVVAYEAQDYDKAIKYFSDYSGSDKIFNARAKACIANCYVALGDYEKALKNFKAAVDVNDGIWTPEYAFNAGLVAEKLGNKEKALEFYTLIKNEYPTSLRSQNIVKYISRVEAK